MKILKSRTRKAEQSPPRNIRLILQPSHGAIQGQLPFTQQPHPGTRAERGSLAHGLESSRIFCLENTKPSKLNTKNKCGARHQRSDHTETALAPQSPANITTPAPRRRSRPGKPLFSRFAHRCLLSSFFLQRTVTLGNRGLEI